MTAQHARAILEYVRYKDWTFVVGDEPDFYLQVRFRAGDTAGGAVSEWSGRKWRLSGHMTKSEVVQTALKAVLTAEEHEAREKFLYQGRAVYGPHVSVDELWWACERKEVRE